MKKILLFLLFCPLFAAAQEARVRLTTTEGESIIRLYDDTPRHRDNFLRLVRTGQLDSTLFFRVIEGFVVQGGDPKTRLGTPSEQQGLGELGYRIPAEISRRHIHVKGAIGAAREGDEKNPKRESSASQFYVVLGRIYDSGRLYDLAQSMGTIFSDRQIEAYTTRGGTPFLDGAYTVFGEVETGMDVWEFIQYIPTDSLDHPTRPVLLLKAEVLESDATLRE